MQKYFYLPEMIYLIDEPNRSICQRILMENEKIFKTVQGSVHNHQNWPGGYYDHIQEVMNFAVVTYKTFNPLRTLLFSLSDALLVLFLHDLEKLWKYEVGSDGELRIKESLEAFESQHQFKARQLSRYGIILTSEQENAMRYVHGELDDYSTRQRMMGPLAAFCHVCDVISARMLFGYPKEGFQDSWWPAQRVNSK